MTIVVAGIDASKKTLNIHLNGRDDTATNDTDGFRKLARILREGNAARVVMEATGRMPRRSCSRCTTAASAPSSSTHVSPGISPRPAASWRRPTGSTPGCWPPSGQRFPRVQRHDRSGERVYR